MRAPLIQYINVHDIGVRNSAPNKLPAYNIVIYIYIFFYIHVYTFTIDSALAFVTVLLFGAETKEVESGISLSRSYPATVDVLEFYYSLP